MDSFRKSEGIFVYLDEQQRLCIWPSVEPFVCNWEAYTVHSPGQSVILIMCVIEIVAVKLNSRSMFFVRTDFNGKHI